MDDNNLQNPQIDSFSYFQMTKNCNSYIPIVDIAAPSVVPSVEGGLGAASVGPVAKKM